MSENQPIVAAAQLAQPAPAPLEEAPPHEPGLSDKIAEWVRQDGPWWVSSFVFHLLLVCLMMLIGTTVASQVQQDAPDLQSDTAESQIAADKIERFELDKNTSLDPTELTTDSLSLNKPPELASVEERFYDNSAKFEEAGGGVAASGADRSLGGLGGFDIMGVGSGAAVTGRPGGVGVGVGTSNTAGAGGGGGGFGGRGSGSRKAMLGTGGGTKASERAVAAALNWIARHQNSDGSWSLSDFRRSCKDATCTGPGQAGTESGATALGLLPFLAAGQTQNTKGPYRATVLNGLRWLMKQQKDGDLAPTAPSKMYSHGLATIALCEAYGLTKDRVIGNKAQQAILYIQSAQHPAGGWRYSPGEPGDTSVVGWQIMALKSGMMAGLTVNSETIRRAQQFLKSVSKGNGGQFAYQPDSGATPPMSSVGLLCMQYLGTRRTDPIMSEGMGVLMGNMPDVNGRNTYYWYYATQVMHNIPGYDWDKWNRQTRKVLIESQCREGCATGSWDPEKPSKDVWGDAGGRLMMTSLSALTLEVYYRYLPLYKLDSEGDAKGPPPPVAPGDKPAADKPPADKPPADKAPAEKPAAEKAPAEKPAAEKPAPAKDAAKEAPKDVKK